MSDPDGGRADPAARLAARWRRVVILGLLGLLLGFAWGIADRPRYAASASVIVEPAIRGDPDPAAPERFVALGSSNEVATVTAEVLGGDVAGADLLSEVGFSAGADGESIVVETTSELPDFAAAAADGFAEGLVAVAADRANVSYRRASERLEEKLAELDPDSPEAAAVSERIADVEEARAFAPLSLGAVAELPDEPIENRSAAVCAGIGLALGLIAGLLAALLGRPHPEVEGEGALADEIGAPLLGSIPAPEAAIERRAPGRIAMTAAAAGRLERIVDAIGIDGTDAPRSVAVLGIEEESDATAVAVVLGIAAADLEVRVLVVDADLADPRLAELVGVERAPGLSDYLAGTAAPREVLRSLQAEIAGEERPLVCVPAGLPAGSGEGLRNARFAALVERLPRVYDLVVLAGPRISPGEDPRALIELADATILVAADDRFDDAVLDRIDAALGDERPVGLITTS